MNIVFAGTPDFAAVSLRRIAQTSVGIAAVVTPPDRPKGRGRKRKPCAVKAAAAELGLPVLQPQTLNDPDVIEALRSLAPDALAVVAYGVILKKTAREVARLGTVNVHASLLPKYRGAAPIQRAILEGELVTGVSLQKMEARLDAGDVLAAKETEIRAEETAGDLFERLAGLGADLLAESLPDLASLLAGAMPQDESQVTYAPPLEVTEGRVTWDQPAAAACRRILAMNPWPKAYAFAGEEGDANRLILLRAREEPSEGGLPGTVLRADGDGLLVAAADGAVAITELQAPGKKPMKAADFLRGYRIGVGDVLL